MLTATPGSASGERCHPAAGGNPSWATARGSTRMGGQRSDAKVRFSSPAPPPSLDSNACGQRLTVSPEPPPPNVSLASHHCAWLASSRCFPGRDSHMMGSGPGLDLRGPSVLPTGPGTPPALFQGFLSSAVGARFPVGVCGREFSVLKEGKRRPCRRVPHPSLRAAALAGRFFPRPDLQTRWAGESTALAFSGQIYGAAGEGLSRPFAVQNGP